MGRHKYTTPAAIDKVRSYAMAEQYNSRRDEQVRVTDSHLLCF